MSGEQPTRDGRETWTRPPEEWPGYEDRYATLAKIRPRIKEICLKYGLLYRDWGDIIEDYLFFNTPYLAPEPAEKNLCIVSDGYTESDSRGNLIDEETIAAYPVTLHISPYASKRDILDYIERLFTTEIAPVQKKYRRADVKIGSQRKRNKALRERDAFIYSLRGQPYKEIYRLVKKKFPGVSESLDEGAVGKIISVETKRRK